MAKLLNMKEILIGRKEEIALLEKVKNAEKSVFVAVYGRRRVGKTFLIRETLGDAFTFQVTGIANATLKHQLLKFHTALLKYFPIIDAQKPPKNWYEAFDLLIHCLENSADERKIVFMDELPWMDTQQSYFISALEHFWNSWATKQKNLTVVICGSAASWMIQNIVRNKGGLHNRLTRRIRLQPFNLNETEQFLRSKYVTLDRYQIVQLYMVTGGIPQYLNDIQSGESATQIIDRLCFSKDGWLVDEFNNLYGALFDSADRHINIVRTLANKPSGMTRTELVEESDLSSGGSLTKVLEELSESGFISEYIPFNKTSRDTLYKLTDEYSLFYLKFIENNKSSGAGTWMLKAASPSWASWSGLAFENIWLKHVPHIKKALGIAAVYTDECAWRFVGKGEERGAQIDLLIDRSDQSINLCEIKFSSDVYQITKQDVDNIANKKSVFRYHTKTNKHLFTTLITTFGAINNSNRVNYINQVVTHDDLFK